jgi:hypothetical protein
VLLAELSFKNISYANYCMFVLNVSGCYGAELSASTNSWTCNRCASGCESDVRIIFDFVWFHANFCHVHACFGCNCHRARLTLADITHQLKESSFVQPMFVVLLFWVRSATAL